jgi:hypothetical protein
MQSILKIKTPIQKHMPIGSKPVTKNQKAYFGKGLIINTTITHRLHHHLHQHSHLHRHLHHH